MGNGYQRLDTVLLTLLKNIFIKTEPLFPWCFFIPIGEYPRPCNTHPVNFKPHFPKQPDIFPEAVIRLSYEGKTVEFSPFISLMDGSVEVGPDGLDISLETTS